MNSNIQKEVVDVKKARAETPGCKNVIHLNNAGAALMPNSVLSAIVEHLQLEADIGGYEAKEQEIDSINRVYRSAALLLGCMPEEIGVIENATRAWDMAFYAIPFKRGDRILTAKAEYISNYLAYLQIAQRTGARIEIIPNDESGQVSIEALRDMVDERVKLISITHIPTHGGLVNPAAEIGEVARENGILYLLDACQSVGQMPIDVNLIGCDILTTAGRKYLRGPRATGILYMRRELIEKLAPPFLDMHAARWVAKDRFEIVPDARRFENWESYYAGKIGLGKAIDYALEWGIANTWERIKTLASKLRRELLEIDSVTLHDLGAVQCGIVTFTVSGSDSAEIKQKLAENNINVSVSLKEYSQTDLAERGIEHLVRASVHYYNTEDEIEIFCSHIKELG